MSHCSSFLVAAAAASAPPSVPCTLKTAGRSWGGGGENRLSPLDIPSERVPRAVLGEIRFYLKPSLPRKDTFLILLMMTTKFRLLRCFTRVPLEKIIDTETKASMKLIPLNSTASIVCVCVYPYIYLKLA